MSLVRGMFVICLSFSLVSSVCFAGDIVPAGTTLENDSYVFTIEEATNLLNRIEELEAKEEQLNYYLELEPIREQKFMLYESNIDLYKFQISEYQAIMNINNLEIDRMHKRAKWRWLENYGMMLLGVAITTGSFLAADAITDQMEAN